MFKVLLDILSNQLKQAIESAQVYVDYQLEGTPPHRVIQNTALLLIAMYTTLSVINKFQESYRILKHHGSDGLKRKLLQTALATPVAGGWLRQTIDKDILQAKVDFIASTLRAHKEYLGSGKLNDSPMSIESIRREQHSILEPLDSDRLARVSGQFYGINTPDVEKYLAESSCVTSRFNPLHADTNKLMPRMYAEVIEQARNLFNGPQGNTFGVITHGGTYSIVEAVIAYKRSAEAKNPGVKFNIVVPETAHWAFDKAGQIASVEVRKCSISPLSKKANIDSMRDLIDKNTILLVGSAPCYPYGIADDIEAIASLGLSKSISMHVDACLGGFYTCFMTSTSEQDKLDFRIKGVTSISADTHKYGQAPKGSSLLLTNSESLANNLSYAYAGNAGGIYATTGIGGSSSLARIQEILTTLKSKGRLEYERITNGISRIRSNILSAITYKQLEDDSVFNKVQIVGDPKLNVIAFVADDSYPLQDSINMLLVLEFMNERKKWDLNVLQNPHGFHLCLTGVHVDSRIDTCEQFIEDFEEAIKYAIGHHVPVSQTKGTCGVYGTKAKIGALADPILEEAAVSYTHAKYNYWPSQKILDAINDIVIDDSDLTIDEVEQKLNYEFKKIAAGVVAEQNGVDVNMLLQKIKDPLAKKGSVISSISK